MAHGWRYPRRNEGSPAWRGYLHDLDEGPQLVGVQLQVKSVCQPEAHDLHGVGIPLLGDKPSDKQ